MNQSQAELLRAVYQNDIVAIIGHLTHGHVHFGYWDDAHAHVPFGEAARLLTQLMIDHVCLQPNALFCDIGCGVGMPALELARQKHLRVEGVNVSSAQVEAATRSAVEAGLETQAHFQVANALQLPFEAGHFDGAWFFESIFHMGHTEALAEAARVLKPGGLLLLTDVVDIGALSEEKKRLNKRLANTEYVTQGAYPGLLDQAGFELEELRDLRHEVLDPFDVKTTEAARDHVQELLEIVQEPEMVEAFAQWGGKCKSRYGYVLVQARRR